MQTLEQILTKQNYLQNPNALPMRQQSHSLLTKKEQLPRPNVQDNGQRLLASFNPSDQATFCSNHEDCIMGNYPTLAQINNSPDYPAGTAQTWVTTQLTNYSEFCGVKGKLTGDALADCANRIVKNYYYLKLSEVMLFFSMLKDGYFISEFYGSVDPSKILRALRTDFLAYRAHYIDTHQPEQEAPKGISREQSMQQVRLALSGDTLALQRYAPAAHSQDPEQIKKFLLSVYPNLAQPPAST